MSNSLRVAEPLDNPCCSRPVRQPLSQARAEGLALQLKALADPVRLRLVSMIAAQPNGPVCVCDLTEGFDLSQPTISHHLKVLHEVGLLNRSKRGVWVYYGLESTALSQLSAVIADPTA